MFKESRFIFEEAAPEGAQCSPAEMVQKLAAERARYEGKSADQRKKIAVDVLAEMEKAGVCGGAKWDVAREQLSDVPKSALADVLKARRKAIEEEYYDKWRFLRPSALSEEQIKAKEKELAAEKEKKLAELTVVEAESWFGNFETLPADEKKLLTDVVAEEKIVAEKWRKYEASGSHPKRVTGANLDVSLADVKRAYTDYMRSHKGWAEVDGGQMYYYDADYGFMWENHFDEAMHGSFDADPVASLRARATYLKFAMERGADLDEGYRAWIYLEAAYDFLSGDEVGRNQVLGDRLLKKATKLFEKVRKDLKPDDTAWKSALAWAYNLRAFSLQNSRGKGRTEPDPSVVLYFTKALQMQRGAYLLDDLVSYLEDFNGTTVEQLVKIMDKYNVDEAEVTSSRSSFHYPREMVVRFQLRNIGWCMTLDDYLDRAGYLLELVKRWHDDKNHKDSKWQVAVLGDEDREKAMHWHTGQWRDLDRLERTYDVFSQWYGDGTDANSREALIRGQMVADGANADELMGKLMKNPDFVADILDGGRVQRLLTERHILYNMAYFADEIVGGEGRQPFYKVLLHDYAPDAAAAK